MANLSKERRDRMIAKLEELKKLHSDDASIAALNEIENALREKKYGLVWEEHSEAVDEMLRENIPVLVADPERRLCKDETLPWNFIIEGDNLQALYLLEKTHHGKVDCIYIDPPYNTGAKDWKYNNDYVDGNDEYRHSKWISMMKSRLLVAKRLLNPADSVMIVTIDEKEYLHLGCLLEELFPEASMQMISSEIHHGGTNRKDEFSRINEFIYFLRFGACSIYRDKIEGHHPIPWRSFLRSSWKREQRPNLFYPIYVNTSSGRIVKVGDALPIEQDKSTVEQIEGCMAVFPIDKGSIEGIWRLSSSTVKELLDKGYFKVNIKREGYSFSYLLEGVINDISTGKITIEGKDEQGCIVGYYSDGREIIPSTQWSKLTHDASQYGAVLLRSFIGDRFTFPKSLYAVHDCINYFVREKKDAIILDFFAGSGTTLHAVNLLNAEDGGHRKCIMVTNNEVGDEKEKEFIEVNRHNHNCVLTRVDDNGKEHYDIIRDSQAFKDFSDKWGIATYVNWPRTVCSINGVNVKGDPLKGDYISTTEEPINMSDGFNANVKMLRCDWTPRKPEDYLLSSALCLHIKELIELQTAQEVDGVKNVIILSKSDYNRVLENPETAALVENVWVNENLCFNAAEMRVLRSKKFRYIPREYFCQELKEVGEYV